MVKRQQDQLKGSVKLYFCLLPPLRLFLLAVMKNRGVFAFLPCQSRYVAFITCSVKKKPPPRRSKNSKSIPPGSSISCWRCYLFRKQACFNFFVQTILFSPSTSTHSSQNAAGRSQADRNTRKLAKFRKLNGAKVRR